MIKKLDTEILSYILECQKGTSYSISQELGYHRKTIWSHLKRLESMGIVTKKGKHYVITEAYNNAIVSTVEALDKIFLSFEDSKITDEGILMLVKYIAEHTRLRGPEDVQR